MCQIRELQEAGVFFLPSGRNPSGHQMWDKKVIKFGYTWRDLQTPKAKVHGRLIK